MKNAVHGYVLGNGIMVVSNDVVEITTIDGEVGLGKIIDISEDGIMIDLEEERCQMDVHFKDVKTIIKIE